jgi:hypothetical protein
MITFFRRRLSLYMNKTVTNLTKSDSSVAQGGAVQHSSVGYSIAPYNKRSSVGGWFGPEGKHFVSGNSLFFIFGR